MSGIIYADYYGRQVGGLAELACAGLALQLRGGVELHLLYSLLACALVAPQLAHSCSRCPQKNLGAIQSVDSPCGMAGTAVGPLHIPRLSGRGHRRCSGCCGCGGGCCFMPISPPPRPCVSSRFAPAWLRRRRRRSKSLWGNPVLHTVLDSPRAGLRRSDRPDNRP